MSAHPLGRPPHFHTAMHARPLTTIAAWLARGYVVVDATDDEHDEDRHGPVYVTSYAAVWSGMRAREEPPDRLSATSEEIAEWTAKYAPRGAAGRALRSRRAAFAERGWW